jgi:3-hydroxybutyryl-CoA dehydrogenase
MPQLEKSESVLQLLQSLVTAGRCGATTGHGFYEWTDARWQSVRERRQRMLAR